MLAAGNVWNRNATVLSCYCVVVSMEHQGHFGSSGCGAKLESLSRFAGTIDPTVDHLRICSPSGGVLIRANARFCFPLPLQTRSSTNERSRRSFGLRGGTRSMRTVEFFFLFFFFLFFFFFF